MRSPLRKLALLAAAALAAVALGACGESHTKVTTGTYAGESGANAPYLNVGPLIYEVQLSRQLNPTNSEDSGYLEGVPFSEGRLLPGQEWFGVFMQVFNNTEHAHVASQAITISDTEGNVYHPLSVLGTNHYIYRGGLVPAKSVLPPPDATAAFGPTQGALLLFKIKVVSLDNRPLEIKIAEPEGLVASASAELDV
ncbi:MAG TPA: hypothetical protein VNV44_01725 [Solirubrobacteraceae bacterium]|jgi:hypothetical protein|nr:hypothetical protein [Solirubrobacteraceae bacterium]